MKIEITGAGNIGASAAKLFTHAGYEVTLSSSRGAETLKDLVAQIGGKAHASKFDDFQ